MATNLMTIGPVSIRDASADVDDGLAAREMLLAALEESFAAEFSLLDGETGELLHTAADHVSCDWTLPSEMCRIVARGGVSEFIVDEDPLLSLAIPLCVTGHRTLVAVGLFLAREIQPRESTKHFEPLLGISGPAANGWIARQTSGRPSRSCAYRS